MGRHAYLITAYDDYYLLDCLIELLIDPRNDTYVHVDKKSTDFDEGKFLSRWRDASLSAIGAKAASLLGRFHPCQEHSGVVAVCSGQGQI